MLDAATQPQLIRGIERLAIRVPPRDQGRTNDHCERWQIHHLMQALQYVGDLRLPVRLHKRESPDFRLETATRVIGVETTEAINPDYVRAQMHPDSHADGSVIDPSLYKWGATGRTTRRIRDEVRRTRLSGPGWAGDSVEREFAQSIADVVESKHAKLCSNYDRFDRDWLLVYHNQPTPCIDIDKAVGHAAHRLAGYWGQGGFAIVWVHKHDQMLRFAKGASDLLYRF